MFWPGLSKAEQHAALIESSIGGNTLIVALDAR